jgi:hypothetical protein
MYEDGGCVQDSTSEKQTVGSGARYDIYSKSVLILLVDEKHHGFREILYCTNRTSVRTTLMRTWYDCILVSMQRNMVGTVLGELGVEMPSMAFRGSMMG